MISETRGPVDHLLKPRSVAVIGVSAKPRTAGQVVVENFQLNDFAGEIHIVGRSDEPILGLPVLKSVDDLPEGIDLAIFTLPAAGVKEALEGCARRKVKSVTIFSSGFAEVGNTAEQEELVRIARDGNIAILGPNCLGYTNYVDRHQVSFALARAIDPLDPNRRDPAVAMVSQSGGLMGLCRTILETNNIPTAYAVSTGNEAGVGFADFVAFFATDPAVGIISIYLEEVRDPQAFLAACRLARANGKPVVMIHPGRSAQGQAAVQSHTGALAGDYASMRVHLARAGVVLCETLEEWADVSEVLARYPEPPREGPGVITFSGGFCAIAHDTFDDLGLPLPPLSEATRAELAPQLPDFIPPKNPLDLGTEVMWKPHLCEVGTKGLLNDPAMGSVAVCIATTNVGAQKNYGTRFAQAMAGSTKPALLSIPTIDVEPTLAETLRENRVIFSRSAERTMRTLATITHHGRDLDRNARCVAPEPFEGLPALASGTLPEWQGKDLLRAIGVRVPAGGLATSVEEAIALAEAHGYPVALKAQSANLAHKTEAGGVILGLRDADALRAGYAQLQANIARHSPGLVLDGVLVEAMAAKGHEFVIGATRDPKWGPILLVGLGGIWIEAIGDVRLMPCDLSHEDIVAEINKLKSAKLLQGFRGSPPGDIEALARTAGLIGRLMLTRPDITEIDLNPVFVHPAGEGITAVDALIVTG